MKRQFIFSAVSIALLLATATAAVSASLFFGGGNNNKKSEQAAAEHPQIHHQCEHDTIKDRPGYGILAKTVKVDYEFHSNEEFLRAYHSSSNNNNNNKEQQHQQQNTNTNKKKQVHEMRQAEALAVNPSGTVANMRFKSFFDSATCPGVNCGRCESEGQTVQTFEGNTVTCAADDVLTPAKRDYVNNKLMPKAMKMLSSLLRINPVVGNLNPGSGYCGTPGTPIPPQHSASGVPDTDFIIYVTAAPKSDPNSQTVAWALKCAQDGSNRPTVAHVNWVPRRLTNAAVPDAISEEMDVSTAVHEICHALGFANPFFPNGYVGLDGTTIVNPGGVVEAGDSTTAPFMKKRTFINSPRVQREVRNHFGCSTAIGAEVEDQGGSGTAGSHFEKRIYQQNVMSGISTTVAAYPSRMLLAFFEDTGHYIADYSSIENFTLGHITFGRGKGCAFLDEKCDSATNKAGGEFCFTTDTTKKRCTYDGLAKGYCGAVSTLSGVPANMQYFGDGSTGSSIQLDDYCPSAGYYSNQRCVDLSVKPVSGGGEQYGGNSRCFQSNLQTAASSLTTAATSAQQPGAAASAESSTRCFQVYCKPGGAGGMYVVVNLRLYDCPAAGGKATLDGLSGYSGEIICPPSANYCPVGWNSSDGSLPRLVPSPEETGTKYAPSYGKPVPGSCSQRIPCAESKLDLMPSCKRFAFEVGRCFGTDCDAAMESWLQAKYSAQCTSGRADFNKYCQEAVAGAKALCRLAGLSAGGVFTGAVVATMLLLVSLVL